MPEGEEMFKYHGYSGPCPNRESQGNSEEAAFRKAMSQSAEVWYPCGCKASAGAPKHCPEHNCPMCHKTTIEYTAGVKHADGTDLCSAPSPAQGTPKPPNETDLQRQLAICEQNGTKWAHFKVADVRALAGPQNGQGWTDRLELLLKLRAADQMAKVADDWVERGQIDSRSALADARLNYGKPYTYEFSGTFPAPPTGDAPTEKK